MESVGFVPGRRPIGAARLTSGRDGSAHPPAAPTLQIHLAPEPLLTPLALAQVALRHLDSPASPCIWAARLVPPERAPEGGSNVLPVTLSSRFLLPTEGKSRYWFGGVQGSAAATTSVHWSGRLDKRVLA